MDEEITEEIRKADEIVDRAGGLRQFLIQILQEANTTFGYLPESVLRRISGRLKIPYAEVYGTASFYKAFSLEPRGKHLIQVCLGTACHVRGAVRILEETERLLSIEAGKTTEDGIFTLETVNCLGACALGPIVVVDGEYHGNMTVTGVPKLIDTYAKRE
ncbi:MAG: NAD(P)H-dependent oxidoreductase subunit E [Spirochaetota bacterium]